MKKVTVKLALEVEYEVPEDSKVTDAYLKNCIERALIYHLRPEECCVHDTSMRPLYYKARILKDE